MSDLSGMDPDNSNDPGPGYRWASLHERFTEKDAREFKGFITHTRRLLTGTLLPALRRRPDNLELHGIIAQIEGLATQVLEQLHDEDPRDAEARPKVQHLLDLINDELHHRHEDDPEDN